MDKSKYISDPRFKGITPFPNKVWLSSPTMHGEELKWVAGVGNVIEQKQKM